VSNPRETGISSRALSSNAAWVKKGQAQIGEQLSPTLLLRRKNTFVAKEWGARPENIKSVPRARNAPENIPLIQVIVSRSSGQTYSKLSITLVFQKATIAADRKAVQPSCCPSTRTELLLKLNPGLTRPGLGTRMGKGGESYLYAL
jgi:hypothetical protein